jgi:hypothetical protein
VDTLAFFTLSRFFQREAKKRKTSVKRAKAPSAKEKKREVALFSSLCRFTLEVRVQSPLMALMFWQSWLSFSGCLFWLSRPGGTVPAVLL